MISDSFEVSPYVAVTFAVTVASSAALPAIVTFAVDSVLALAAVFESAVMTPPSVDSVISHL
ncbi:MAG: hypothetical protein IJ158_02545 [Treponema sp.]|nr:hypothetical protein [Treponema sp.]